jgi:hypothetical protein
MDRHVHALAIASVLGLLASGCAFFAPRFALVEWSPTEGRIADPSGIAIWMRFSGPADRDSVEQAFSLTKDGGPVCGSFAWEGEVLRFVPVEGLEKNRNYLLVVGTSAEDEEGVSLDEEFRFAFSTKAEELRPTLLSVLPADGATLTERFASIAMIFSEAVDRESLYAAFGLSPSLRGRFDWSEGDSACAFVPLEPYAWQTEYSLTIQDKLSDLSGNLLAKPYKSRFTIGTDKVPPLVRRLANAVNGIEGAVVLAPSLPAEASPGFASGWESTWGLVLTFSEPVERGGLESRIRIEPVWSYAIVDEATLGLSFVLRPQERLSRDTLYSVAICPGVKDAQGNESVGESVFKFRVDGPSTASPVVTWLRFRDNPGAASGSETYDEKRCDHGDDYTAIAIGSPVFAIGSQVETYADLYFSLAAGASLDLYSLMEAFSIEASNSCASFFVKKIQLSGFADPQPLALAGSTCARVIMDVQNASDSGLVTFKIGEGLVDSGGNPIAGAWRLSLLK